MTRPVTKTREEYDLLYDEIRKYLELHHQAKATGYIGLQKVYIETYVGKYGTGYIVHKPTIHSFNIEKYKTRNIHDIEYWIRTVV